jgi:hypothetical protein
MVLNLTIGLFFILHGLVHLLYFGQSRRLFELQPGMTWPKDSWILSKWFPQSAERIIAGVSCIFSATCFVAAGIAFLADISWWRDLVILSAILSSLIFFLFWNGEMKKLHDQGAIGILINLMIVVMVIMVR